MPLFCAGGIATPADAALVMQLGAEAVFVGSGIFKSEDPARRARAIVEATTHYDDPQIVAKVSRGLGASMPGLEVGSARAAPGRPRLVGGRCRRRRRRGASRWTSASSPCRATSPSTARALAELGVDSRARCAGPTDLAGLDGIVLPGGESTTMSMLLESSGLFDPLGKELAAGLPAFGTCAGMILLATDAVDGRADQRCFGAIDITVRRNGYGRQLESFECDLDVAAPRRRAAARRVHPGAAGRVDRCGGRGPGHVGPAGRRPRRRAARGAVADAGGRRRCCAARARCWWPPSIPSSPRDRRVHELFVSMIEPADRAEHRSREDEGR